MTKRTDTELGIVLTDSMVEFINNKDMTDAQIGLFIRGILWNSMEYCKEDVVVSVLAKTLLNQFNLANSRRLSAIDRIRESKRRYEASKRQRSAAMDKMIANAVGEFHGNPWNSMEGARISMEGVKESMEGAMESMERVKESMEGKGREGKGSKGKVREVYPPKAPQGGHGVDLPPAVDPGDIIGDTERRKKIAAEIAERHPKTVATANVLKALVRAEKKARASKTSTRRIRRGADRTTGRGRAAGLRRTWWPGSTTKRGVMPCRLPKMSSRSPTAIIWWCDHGRARRL